VHKVIADIYERLPRRLQEAALEVHGVGVRRRANVMARICEGIRHTEVWTLEEQVVYTNSRLRVTLTDAIQEVPRYQHMRHLLAPLRDDKVPPLAILAQLPIVSKAEVSDSPDAFRSSRYRGPFLLKAQTSGTTGTPLGMWFTRRGKLLADALWHRRAIWTGYQPNDWVARIVGDPIVPMGRGAHEAPIRVSHTARRVYVSSFHLTEKSAPMVLRTLNDIRPSFIMGYPSALAYLAQIGLMTVGLEWRPRAIFYSSEPLLPHQGSVLRDYFDCPIRGLYGMAERVLSAAECPEGNFHLGLCDGYLEGQFDGSGNENNAVVTGLANPAMPLLRYQLDDSLQVRPGIACRCGRTLPVIEAVMNRRGDMVSTIAGMQIPAPAEKQTAS
jgi:phenylacetate-CoA ligase